MFSYTLACLNLTYFIQNSQIQKLNLSQKLVVRSFQITNAYQATVLWSLCKNRQLDKNDTEKINVFLYKDNIQKLETCLDIFAALSFERTLINAMSISTFYNILEKTPACKGFIIYLKSIYFSCILALLKIATILIYI